MNEMKTVTRISTKVKTVFLMTIVFTSSCNKEQLEYGSGKVTDIGKQKTEGGHCMSNVTVVCNNILRFNDLLHYQSVYDCLESSYENWCNNFDNQNSALSDDQFNQLISDLGWDEEQPLNEFESMAPGFVSLRTHINALETAWLAQPNPDPNQDPDNHFVDDIIQRTMMNQFGMICIGNTVLYYAANGVWYELPAANCALIGQIQNTGIVPNGYPGIIIVHRPQKAGSNNCELFYDKSDFKDCSSQRRFKWRLKYAIADMLNANRAIATIKYYKKKSNGNWQRWSTSIKVRVSDTFWYGQACTSTGDDIYAQKGFVRRKKLTARDTMPTIDWKAIPNNELTGYYFSEGASCTTTHTASW